MAILKNIRFLEAQIDSFLDDIDQGALNFNEAIKDYVKNDMSSFEKRMIRIDKLESDADKRRRDIRFQLYTQMLIPESRGDVLGLLENSDNVLDLCKKTLLSFEIEKPVIPDSLKQTFIDLTDVSTKAVNGLVKAVTAYFKENSLINNYIGKVNFFEKEADKFEIALKRELFSDNMKIKLSHKNQLRYFCEKIAWLSDESQEVCERLSVAAIKRTL